MENPNESDPNDSFATVPNTPGSVTHSDDEEIKDTEDGLIGELHPLNRDARDAVSLLTLRSSVGFYEYHYTFIRTNPPCFVLSLSNLPEYAQLGWRIGRGRKNLKNRGVDLLLMGDGDGVAGIHARFTWIKGGGGFFLVADNMRGKTATLNGEVLSNEQRLIPFRNTIGIGECYFTFKFPNRTAKQEELFQLDLATFYSKVLEDSVPLVTPTPCGHEMMMGEWVVRNAISKGAFGHVYAVTHTRTGKAAAAKELWRTPSNKSKVDSEVAMARYLLNIKHKHLGTPFHIHHELIGNKVEMARIMTLLDDTWKPGSADVVDKYIFFSPLATSTFWSLITSKASNRTRTILFTQILEGIAFLHKEGIIHRDIKPPNLTVQSYDPPLARIIDFGCATFKTEILYDRPGTIPYLAPEQQENKTHERSVDYWACGLVALQLLGRDLPTQPARQINQDDYNEIHRWISQQSGQPLVVCCDKMIQWTPEYRMTADNALRIVLAPYREREASNKRKLIDTTEQ